MRTEDFHKSGGCEFQFSLSYNYFSCKLVHVSQTV